MSKKKTHEEYISELAKIHPNIEVIGQYAGSNVKILHKCRIDNYISQILDFLGEESKYIS